MMGVRGKNIVLDFSSDPESTTCMKVLKIFNREKARTTFNRVSKRK